VADAVSVGVGDGVYVWNGLRLLDIVCDVDRVRLYVGVALYVREIVGDTLGVTLYVFVRETESVGTNVGEGVALGVTVDVTVDVVELVYVGEYVGVTEKDTVLVGEYVGVTLNVGDGV
jgi:hypothetical protein